MGLTPLLAIVAAAALGIGPAPQTMRERVTAASAVRLRAEPSVEVRIVATLPLGERLVELAVSTDGEWVRVRTEAGQEGWISAPLTAAVPPGARDRVLEDIARVRAQGGYGFQAAVELLAVIDDLLLRAGPERARAATLTLYRLQTLKDAAASTTMFAESPIPVRGWFESRPAWFFHDELGGRWMLRHDAVMAEHDRYRREPAAHDMAWLAVINGFGGECEGEVSCYADRTNRLEGEYLRVYASGPQAQTALRRVLNAAIAWRSLMNDPRSFRPASHCGPLATPLAALRTATAGARPRVDDSTLQKEALRILDNVADVCAGPARKPL